MNLFHGLYTYEVVILIVGVLLLLLLGVVLISPARSLQRRTPNRREDPA